MWNGIVYLTITTYIINVIASYICMVQQPIATMMCVWLKYAYGMYHAYGMEHAPFIIEVLDLVSGIARLASWWGIARPTDCIIRVFECSIRIYQTFWQTVGWALKQIGWACALPLPTLATPLDLVTY